MSIIEDSRNAYYEALFDTDRERALAVVDQALIDGTTPEDIVFKVVIPVIDRMINELTVSFDATISQHYMTSKVSEEVTTAMIEKFEKTAIGEVPIVLGSAWGDFHGLGKRIVGGCLKANMFEVHDLGLNVIPEKFVARAVEVDAPVIGISSMMIHSAEGENGPLKVREIIDREGLGGRIKIVVGGAPYRFDPDLYRAVGADAWADNAVSAVETISKIVKRGRE